MTETRTPIKALLTEAEKLDLYNAIRLTLAKGVFHNLNDDQRDRLSGIFGLLEKALSTEIPKQW